MHTVLTCLWAGTHHPLVSYLLLLLSRVLRLIRETSLFMVVDTRYPPILREYLADSKFFFICKSGTAAQLTRRGKKSRDPVPLGRQPWYIGIEAVPSDWYMGVWKRGGITPPPPPRISLECWGIREGEGIRVLGEDCRGRDTGPPPPTRGRKLLRKAVWSKIYQLTFKQKSTNLWLYRVLYNHFFVWFLDGECK